ncbi:MAG: metallophosphoesterase [Ruminococcus sp.]|nr:metallophosphoesterase [Ruminococcus sp.]MCM1480556.1 metallophosphoesterase [Muribaculaceae bacterium]
MRIIVMSDSHGISSQVEKIIRANAGADMFLHLGDGESEVEKMRLKYPNIDLRFVSGNCDRSGGSPKSIIVGAMGRKIFCTHGHVYRVKDGIEPLVYAAKQNGCCAALFGHTHERFIGVSEGVDVMNPGSCAQPRDGMKPSYGYVDVTENGVFMNIIEVGY